LLYEFQLDIKPKNMYHQPKSDTSRDIKKGMDKYETKIKSGEAPGGDETRSDE